MNVSKHMFTEKSGNHSGIIYGKIREPLWDYLWKNQGTIVGLFMEKSGNHSGIIYGKIREP